MSKVFVNFSFIRFFRSRSWFCLGFFGRPFIQGKSFSNVWCRNAAAAQECHSCDEHELFFVFTFHSLSLANDLRILKKANFIWTFIPRIDDIWNFFRCLFARFQWTTLLQAFGWFSNEFSIFFFKFGKNWNCPTTKLS